jgi:hypothetical protein
MRLLRAGLVEAPSLRGPAHPGGTAPRGVALEAAVAHRLALSFAARQAGANRLGAAHGLLRGDPCGQQVGGRVGAAA